QSGGGVWFAPDDPKNKPVGVPFNLMTRNSGELAAILHVIQTTSENVVLNFRLNSKYLVRKLTIDVPSLESSGWTGDRDKTLISTIVAALRVRGTRSTFCETGADGDAGKIQFAIELAKNAISDYPPENTIDADDLRTEVPRRYQVQGVSMANTSQATFYHAIRETRPRVDRVKTRIMLDITRYAVKEQSGKTPSDEEIWKSIRNKDITRTIRDFYWRCLHQSYKCGTYWLNLPTYEHRAKCPTCQVDETMEHILVECSAPGRELVWSLCRELWEKKHKKMPKLTRG
ncbi:hypothetical protein B0H11DRAFT_1692858, partial [Mycena galericulata]